MNIRTPALAAAASLTLALLAGCIVAPVGPAYPAYGEQEVVIAPPPPRVEVVGVAPVPGYFWIGGHWGWRGGAHVWAPGRWEAPRPGYQWVPHQWVQHGRGWREAPGRWERR